MALFPITLSLFLPHLINLPSLPNYDPDEALMNNQINTGLDRTIMRTLQDMLHRHHHGVTLCKQALELTNDMPPEHQCKIALQYLPGTDRRRYNLPTISGEVAAVVPGTGEEFSNRLLLSLTYDRLQPILFLPYALFNTLCPILAL
jgi:hypothetical protein